LQFEERWNFPNGIGAVDGKRIVIQQPANTGSHFYDYKGICSFVLFLFPTVTKQVFVFSNKIIGMENVETHPGFYTTVPNLT